VEKEWDSGPVDEFEDDDEEDDDEEDDDEEDGADAEERDLVSFMINPRPGEGLSRVSFSIDTLSSSRWDIRFRPAELDISSEDDSRAADIRFRQAEKDIFADLEFPVAFSQKLDLKREKKKKEERGRY